MTNVEDMNGINRKALIRDTFDAVSSGYDNTALRFFSESAEHLASCLCLRGDEAVLDVATGTGNAAIALERRTFIWTHILRPRSSSSSRHD